MSGVTGLVVDQQAVMAEMKDLAAYYFSTNINSVVQLLNQPLISEDQEIELWMQNVLLVDVPKMGPYTAGMLDTTLTVFFNLYKESPMAFQEWLSMSAKTLTPMAVQGMGVAMGGLGQVMFLGIKLSCADTCTPEGNRKEKVGMKIGLTEGNSQSAFIWLVCHAPRRSPGFGAVASLIPDAMAALKRALKQNVYCRIWVKIEYYECKKTACYAFWDELDWHEIKTYGWSILLPPAGDIRYENPAYNNAWWGTKTGTGGPKQKSMNSSRGW